MHVVVPSLEADRQAGEGGAPEDLDQRSAAVGPEGTLGEHGHDRRSVEQ
jgi:hypothetical protein